MARSLLFGTSVSPGIAIGVLRFAHNVQTVEMRRISPREVEGEQEQLRAAVTHVRAALQEAMTKVPEDLAEYREVIAAQIELARDPKLVGSALARIEKELVCAAWALDSTVEQLCSIFRNMDDPYLRDRAQDIRAVGLRLRECLAGSCALPAAAGAGILAAQDLSPADVMDMDFKDVRAVITAEGGPTSHTAILSRGLHIPALVGVTGLLETGRPGERVIVDGLKAAPAHVVFRTLDAGADKMLRAQEALREPNPALGLRGIRFCLRHQKIFRSQLRALMRAGVEGNVSLLLPMISGLAEVQSVRRIMQELQQELRAAGLPHAADLPLGIMVETPAAVLIADALARECDFFSIGTNDLIHYLMAIDRNNLHVGYLNEALHPAVVRSLKRIIDSAHREGIGVSVCGEHEAHDPPLGRPDLHGHGPQRAHEHRCDGLAAHAARTPAGEPGGGAGLPYHKHHDEQLGI